MCESRSSLFVCLELVRNPKLVRKRVGNFRERLLEAESHGQGVLAGGETLSLTGNEREGKSSQQPTANHITAACWRRWLCC